MYNVAVTPQNPKGSKAWEKRLIVPIDIFLFDNQIHKNNIKYQHQ